MVALLLVLLQASELEALLAAWSQQALQQQHQQGGKSSGSSSSAGLLLRHGSSLPRSNSSSIAPLLLATDGIDNSKLQRLAGAAAVGSAAAAGEGSGCVGSSGSIGRVSLSRLSLGLVLDERRLKELLAGGIQVGAVRFEGVWRSRQMLCGVLTLFLLLSLAMDGSWLTRLLSVGIHVNALHWKCGVWGALFAMFELLLFLLTLGLMLDEQRLKELLAEKIQADSLWLEG
jgi:hypothetical protein